MKPETRATIPLRSLQWIRRTTDSFRCAIIIGLPFRWSSFLKCSRQAMISVGNDASRMLKKATFSPAQPWRAKTRLVSSKAAASYHFIWGGWDDSNCARRSHPPAHWHAETCQWVGEGLQIPQLPQREQADC